MTTSLTWARKPSVYKSGSDMLSEEAQRELKALARSAQARDDFERVREIAARLDQQGPRLDRFIRFLTDVTRMFPNSFRPLPPVEYEDNRL
jgi:hypothetical protein